MRDGTLVGVLILTSWVGFWTSSGLHMKTGSSSLMGHGALICGGVGAVGGTSPRSSVRGAWIASSSSGGASWTPLIAAVRCAVASRILSVVMMVGTGMACWQNWNVSVMRSPTVSAIKTQMQRYWLVEWERFQAWMRGIPMCCVGRVSCERHWGSVEREGAFKHFVGR